MGMGRRQQNRAVGWQSDGQGGFGFGPTGTGVIGDDMGGFTSVEELFMSGINGGFAMGESIGDSLLWTYRGALSIPGVARAASMLANIVGGMEFDAYTDHGRDQLELVEPRPPLIDQPAPPETRITTMSSWTLDYLFHGNSIGIVASRDSTGRPTAVFPIPAPWVWARRITEANQDGLQAWMAIGEVEYSILGKSYSQHDVVHVKGLCAPGGLRGFGVLEQHLMSSLRTSHLQQREAQNISRHGVPPGYLRVTSDSPEANDPEVMEKTKWSWMRNRDRGGVAVLNNSIDFTPISWNPDNMQMVQARQLSLLDIANIMGVPPPMIGAKSGDNMHYSTSEGDALSLVKFSVGGILQHFEEAFSLLYPRGTVIRADLDQLMRADTLTRYQTYNLGIVDGWLKRSEVRDKENLPPIAGIDDEAPTGAAAKLEDKAIPIDVPGFKQVLQGDIGNVPGAVKPSGAPGAPAGPVQAVAQRLPTTPSAIAAPNPTPRAAIESGEQYRSVSMLEFKPGRPLWTYWTVGAGTEKWQHSPNPWTALRDALIAEGVPLAQVSGLATNIMQATPAGRALFAAHHGGH
jgi:HK97 family phage portal protein